MAAVLSDLVQVDLQPREEHDVQQTDRAEEMDGLVPGQNPEAVRTEDDSGGDQPDDLGQVQSPCEQRHDQNQRHDTAEDQYRIGKR